MKSQARLPGSSAGKGRGQHKVWDPLWGTCLCQSLLWVLGEALSALAGCLLGGFCFQERENTLHLWLTSKPPSTTWKTTVPEALEKWAMGWRCVPSLWSLSFCSLLWLDFYIPVCDSLVLSSPRCLRGAGSQTCPLVTAAAWALLPPSPHLTSLVRQSQSTLYQLVISSRGMWGLGQRLVKTAVPPGRDVSANHSPHSSQAVAVLPRALPGGGTPNLQVVLALDVWLELHRSCLYWYLLCYSSLLIRMSSSNPEQLSSWLGCRQGRWGLW